MCIYMSSILELIYRVPGGKILVAVYSASKLNHRHSSGFFSKEDVIRLSNAYDQTDLESFGLYAVGNYHAEGRHSLCASRDIYS